MAPPRPTDATRRAPPQRAEVTRPSGIKPEAGLAAGRLTAERQWGRAKALVLRLRQARSADSGAVINNVNGAAARVTCRGPRAPVTTNPEGGLQSCEKPRYW